jgi:hypothetical protein
MKIERDAAFAMVVDENDIQHWPLLVHLPPWWEMNDCAATEAVSQPRKSPINKPPVDRDVLYGEAFLQFISDRVLDVVNSDPWRDSDAPTHQQARYSFTIQVHRDWLMTPRSDLDGRMPRQLLHGSHSWSEKVTWGQRHRFEDAQVMIALPKDWADPATAPMGSQEMSLYFDLCRELIGASWFWCESDREKLARQDRETTLAELKQFLQSVKDDWLNGLFEGGSPPSFIIECDRRRVPRGGGLEIDGIDGVQTEEHIADCDCPICQMMADGMFGTSFTSIDGHHLDMDQEFAFSTVETREEWEQQQRDYEEFNAKFKREQAERDAAGETDDPFGSAWSGINDDGPIPGDSGGHLKMAFMVAEIISELEMTGAPKDEIKSLNECFANYRRSDFGHRSQRAEDFKANLQFLADRYPSLVSKSADLQSRIDDAARRPMFEDDEHPF